MIALDTDVLLRMLRADDPAQSERARALMTAAAERGERLYIADPVLSELVWLLTNTFKYPKSTIASILHDLLRTAQFVFQSHEAAVRALARYGRGTAGFVDYFIVELAQAAGCDRVATFDRRLLKASETIEP